MLFALTVLWTVGCGESRDKAPRSAYPLGKSSAGFECHPYIDGQFTVVAKDGYVEWPDEPVTGIYGDLYVQFCDGVLSMLNDWHFRDDAPIEPDWYNLFQLSTDIGQLDIRVYGDQHIEALLDGEPIPAVGASGFHPSPRHPQPHTIFEFSIPFAGNRISMVEKDPAPGVFPTGKDALVAEPTGFEIEVGYGQIDSVQPTHGPILVATRPYADYPEAPVTLHGANLGMAGIVRIGGEPATVLSWEPDTIVAIIPKVAGNVIITAETGGQVSNAVPFEVLCDPFCDGRECGIDGCGGSCGSCSFGSVCELGQCVCVPDCAGKQCGSDGCSGSCGSCPSGYACQLGQCACIPDCAGKQCGSDSCGGSCGSCPTGHVCQGNQCLCIPDCAGKQCGSDGCSGSCGSCPPGQFCADYQCQAGPN